MKRHRNRWVNLIVSAGLPGLALVMALCGGGQAASPSHGTQQSPALDPETPLSAFVLESWGLNERLPDLSVFALAEDHDGYLWLGTLLGLVRFDGLDFTLFDDRNAGPGQDQFVQALLVDSADQLWVVTRGNRLLVFREGALHEIATPEGFRKIESIFEIEGGRVWITSFDQVWEGSVDDLTAVQPLEHEDQRFILLPAGEREPGRLLDLQDVAQGLIDSQQAVVETRRAADGTWWLALQDSRRPNTLNLIQLSADLGTVLWSSREAGFERIAVTHLDPAGAVWMGAAGHGLVRYFDGDLSVMTMAEGLPGTFIHAILTNTDGHLWLAFVENGLARLKPAAVKTLSVDDALPGDDIRSVLRASDGRIWIAMKGHGVMVMDGDARQLYQSSDGLVDDHAYALAEDNDGAIWVGAVTGVSRIAAPEIRSWGMDEGFPSAEVRAVIQAPDGTMWFGTVDGLVKMRAGSFQLQTEFAGTEARYFLSLYRDRDDQIWAGTTEYGAFVFSENEVTHLAKDQVGTHVRAFHQDPSGDMWIGTRAAGITRVRDGRLASVRRRDGLLDDGANILIGDQDGHLWMGSRRGISTLPFLQLNELLDGTRDRLAPRTFAERDGMRGLQTAASSGPGALQRKSGELWFATTQGIAIIDRSIVSRATAAPKAIIETVFADNETLTREAIAPPGARSIEIHYTTTSMVGNEQSQFRYQLIGVDPEPIAAGMRRVAHYSNVSPGQYEFEVHAANAEGVWSAEPARRTLTVQPWFYQTRWFAALTIAALVLTVVALYRWRVARYKVIQARLERGIAERTEKIAAQADRLRLLDEAKSRFFANVTHELRTPLTTLIGPLTDWLSDNEKNVGSNLSSPIRRARESSQRMLDLINQLMSYARIESGATTVQLKRDDLIAWLATVWDRFVPLAQSRNLKYSLKGPDEPFFAEFDGQQLDFAISNLLNNAFKFTPPGGEITVSLATQTIESEPAVTITVADTGCGISLDHQPLVFERFYQSSETHVEGQAGTGIGLSVVRDVVRLHGGEVTLTSQPKRGSAFTVSIPLVEDLSTSLVLLGSHDFRSATADDAKVGTADENEADEDLDRYTILVVEDNAEVRDYVVQGLGNDYRIIDAPSGNQGAALARRLMPDLIVCDIMMPDGSGLDLLNSVRSNQDTQAVPVILLTAKAESTDTIVGLDAGANDYITKPFSMAELKARIAAQIDAQNRLARRLRRTATEQIDTPVKESRNSSGDDFLHKVSGHIQARLAEPELSPDDLADALHMSRAAFYRKFQSASTESLSALIRSIRLGEAQRLLTDGEGTVTEVAYAVGFNSQSYFSRCFKNHFGSSPSEVLAQVQQVH